METNDKALLDDYIMAELDGFTEFNDGIYVFVAGCTDQSPSVLYDFFKDVLFLIHPNLSIKNKVIITIPELIKLLRFKQSLTRVFLQTPGQEGGDT